MIVVDFWGSMACFCPPYAKVDRMTYPVPTPSAMRGALASVYGKPAEFWWAIRKIEIMRPIQYLSIKRNEVTSRLSPGKDFICVLDCRTQRAMTVLKDVRYRVTAEIIKAKTCDKSLHDLYKQANRRFSKGQCFQQPYLGIRECICNFALADETRTPIPESMDFNLMVFDTHIPYDNRKDAPFFSSLYHAVMVDGVINVPDFDSPQVIKLASGFESLMGYSIPESEVHADVSGTL